MKTRTISMILGIISIFFIAIYISTSIPGGFQIGYGYREGFSDGYSLGLAGAGGASPAETSSPSPEDPTPTNSSPDLTPTPKSSELTPPLPSGELPAPPREGPNFLANLAGLGGGVAGLGSIATLVISFREETRKIKQAERDAEIDKLKSEKLQAEIAVLKAIIDEGPKE